MTRTPSGPEFGDGGDSNVIGPEDIGKLRDPAKRLGRGDG
jgi:hypothetical protein